MNRISLFTLTVLGGLSLAATAQAHVTLEQQEAAAGSIYKAVVRVPHGCEGEAPLKGPVQIPEGFINVKPPTKAGGAPETVNGADAKTYEYHGTSLREGVRENGRDGRQRAEPQQDFTDRRPR